MLAPRLVPVIVIIASATALGGCFYSNAAQAPMAKTYPYSEQQRMQAAQHWQVLAEHEARGILQHRHLRTTPLYLPEKKDWTSGEFARSYRSLLTSELVSGGALVSSKPEGAAELDFDVEVVHHTDRGFVRPYPGVISLATLATGIGLLVAPSPNAGLALIPPIAAADITSGSWTKVGDEEVIITTEISDSQRVLYSSSNIYYINRGDRGQYEPLPQVRLDDQW